MVQILKEEVADKIYRSAIDEFYAKGFKSTTIKGIANSASVSVGLVYTYYKNKEDLFETIVTPTYSLIKTTLTEINNSGNLPSESFILKKEMQLIIDLLKHRRKQLVILLDKSDGTRYENAKEEIINLAKVHIQKNLSKKIKGSQGTIDEEFYHILANNFFEGLFEIARHYKNEKWADNMVELLAKQYFYGINALIE